MKKVLGTPSWLPKSVPCNCLTEAVCPSPSLSRPRASVSSPEPAVTAEPRTEEQTSGLPRRPFAVSPRDSETRRGPARCVRTETTALHARFWRADGRQLPELLCFLQMKTPALGGKKDWQERCPWLIINLSLRLYSKGRLKSQHTR